MTSNVGTRFEFTNAPPTTLAADITPTDMTFTLTSGDGYATGDVGNFPLVVNYGNGTEEIILCSARNGNAVTVALDGRGYAGTTAAAHAANETVAPCWPATEADADNLHNASTANVHGLAGSVVGTTDAQTLTNKTLTAPTVNGGTISAATLTGPAISGYKEAVGTASGAAVTYDATVKNIWTTTLSANLTVTLTAGASGSAFEVVIVHTQDATGGRTVTWPASVKWPNGVAPSPATTASAVNVYSLFTVDGGTTWLGFLAGRAMG